MCLWLCASALDVREIGDVDEGVVEGGEDAGHAEDEFACVRYLGQYIASGCLLPWLVCGSGGQTFSDLGTEGDVLLRCALDLLLGCHLCCCRA